MRCYSISAILLAVVGAILETAIAGKFTVCYYGRWSSYRTNNGTYDIEDIDPTLCSHVIYSFAGLDATSNTIYSLDPYNDLKENYGKDGYNRFTRHINKARRNPRRNNRLTKRNSRAIPMLAIGGWGEGSTKYSDMAMDASKRKTFVKSVVAYLEKYSFKGLDVDWEYPTQRGGRPQDKQNFVTLLKELKTAFSNKYQLGVAVGAGAHMIDFAYDIPAISRYVDFITLMAYDLAGPWDGKTGHHTAYDEVKKAINNWIDRGVTKSKLVLGTATYGRSFELINPADTDPNSSTKGPGRMGPYTKEAGFLGYQEICEMKWTKVFDQSYRAPYAYDGTGQWVGFDDKNSIREKCRLARKLGLGGGASWSVENDDFRNNCRYGKNSLTRALIFC